MVAFQFRKSEFGTQRSPQHPDQKPAETDRGLPRGPWRSRKYGPRKSLRGLYFRCLGHGHLGPQRARRRAAKVAFQHRKSQFRAPKRLPASRSKAFGSRQGPPKMVLGGQRIRTTNNPSWSVFSVPWARSLRPAAGPKEGLKGSFPAPKEPISRLKEVSSMPIRGFRKPTGAAEYGHGGAENTDHGQAFVVRIFGALGTVT